MTADDGHVCEEHVWELRGVSFDMQIGALEDYECTRCPAVTVRQSAAEVVADSGSRRPRRQRRER